MFSRLSLLSIFPVLAVLAFLAMPAHAATIITYNTASSWQAALSSFQNIDFEGLAPAGSMTTYGSGLTASNVQFVGLATSNPMGVLDTTLSSWFNYGTLDALFLRADRLNAGSTVPYIHVTLPTPVTAVGFNIFTASPSALAYTVAAAGTQFTASTFALPIPAFFGMTSDTPFSTVDLTLQGTVYNGGTYGFVDNFSFGAAASAVPESSSCILVGVGLIGLGLMRRRKNHA